jgi:hypothetical protein
MQRCISIVDVCHCMICPPAHLPCPPIFVAEVVRSLPQTCRNEVVRFHRLSAPSLPPTIPRFFQWRQRRQRPYPQSVNVPGRSPLASDIVLARSSQPHQTPARARQPPELKFAKGAGHCCCRGGRRPLSRAADGSLGEIGPSNHQKSGISAYLAPSRVRKWWAQNRLFASLQPAQLVRPGPPGRTLRFLQRCAWPPGWPLMQAAP